MRDEFGLSLEEKEAFEIIRIRGAWPLGSALNVSLEMWEIYCPNY